MKASGNFPFDDPDAFMAGLAALDDEGLLSYRFELYDRLEIAPGALGLCAALDVVYAVEQRRQVLRSLRPLAAVAVPDADPDVFVDALVALAGHQRALGIRGAAGWLVGAIEVAERRAAETSTGKDNDDDDERTS